MTYKELQMCKDSIRKLKERLELTDQQINNIVKAEFGKSSIGLLEYEDLKKLDGILFKKAMNVIKDNRKPSEQIHEEEINNHYWND
jgi:hypothetical protein